MNLFQYLNESTRVVSTVHVGDRFADAEALGRLTTAWCLIGGEQTPPRPAPTCGGPISTHAACDALLQFSRKNTLQG